MPRPRRDEVIATLRAHRDQLIAAGVKTLSIFGSVARDQAREGSDIDVLVEFDAPPTFRGYMHLVALLEDLFGRKVDVATPGGLKPRAREIIERDLVRVA